MQKKLLSSLVASLGALGAVLWWNRRQAVEERPAQATREEMPASATSLSAQPHKRTRLVPPASTVRREVPRPDSADEGLTPYYFVPGEALLSLQGSEPPAESFLHDVAQLFEASYAPFGGGVVSYPVPEGEGWLTVVRLRWSESTGYEESLARFARLEEQVNAGVAWGSTRVVHWMPNWLGTVAADTRWYTPGGPGAYPRPLAAPGHLPLTDAPFLQEWRDGMQHEVTLAVLDAFPTAEQIAARPLPASLDSLVAGLREARAPLSLDARQHYATFRTGLPFEMSDHGLMTAWLASEVIGEAGMQRVRLEPIRVATAEGVCSTADVIAGLAPLVARARAGEPMVVLLAFVVGMMDIVPPRLRLYEEHYEALRLLCLALSEAGATLLGAAGNDANGLQHPPRTRRPAAFRSVIEVTAGQLEQTDLALYANQAKALVLFGGEASLQNQIVSNLPSLVGPAVAPEHRTSNDGVEPNPSGWVAWAGTSFAAALAAGLAVLLRSREPQMKMWDVRTQLRKVATGTRNPGNVPFVELVKPNYPS